MSDYQYALNALEQLKCPTCQGRGKCDDADLGDISFNTWTCTSCEGHGTNKAAFDLPIIKQLIVWLGVNSVPEVADVFRHIQETQKYLKSKN